MVTHTNFGRLYNDALFTQRARAMCGDGVFFAFHVAAVFLHASVNVFNFIVVQSQSKDVLVKASLFKL